MVDHGGRRAAASDHRHQRRQQMGPPRYKVPYVLRISAREQLTNRRTNAAERS
jgi:hypothetical protein